VAVLIPYDPSSLIKDSLDFGAIIVGVLDSNAPSQLDGDDIVVLEATRVHILSDDVKIGDSASDPVARKSDVELLRQAFNTHSHLYLPGPGAASPTNVPSAPVSLPAYSSNTKVK
jgi:hypothetical protein